LGGRASFRGPSHLNLLEIKLSWLCTKRDKKVHLCDLIVILGQYA
jgi:hypothetical protein